ncbi:MAG: Cadmium-transporting ATPase [bacterium]|nr:Cadmium-transporting ATPase [bacterium]
METRRWEVAFTTATLVLLLTSAIGSRLGMPMSIHLTLDLLAYFTGGFFAAKATIPRLFRGELDVDFLMLVAALGAATIGHRHEGITLLFLFSLSNTLQSFAMERSKRAIDSLIGERPNQAAIRRDGIEVMVSIEEIRVGDVLLVRPGQMVPTDGVVHEGLSEMDESSITGESRPVSKGPGDPVYAGAMNGTGTLDVVVTRHANDSTLARIVKMVESAQTHKARTQRFLERFENIYALSILFGVLAAALLPWMLGQDFRTSFYRAMVLLVVASPCALVISTPAAILSAIAAGARQGILFKGGAYLEKMAEVRVVVFDKTGTLTTGKPGVTDVVLAREAPSGFTESELLAYAAALESRSEHTLAKEIVRAANEKNLKLPEMTDFIALPGRGVRATLSGYLVWIGSNRLYEEHGETIPDDLLQAKNRFEAEGKSALILHRELERRGNIGTHEETGGWLGMIALSDTLREDAPEAVRMFRRLGIERTVMLTGDNENVARTIASQAGITEFRANLLPEDKVEALTDLQAEYGEAMMIGDGVNDAPALAHAAIGVAMGAAGTDVALESAHCVLMGDRLVNVPRALDLSRRAVRVIRQNLAFSLAVIAFLVMGVFFFTLPLPLGVVGHEGSTLLVCLNGLRLLRQSGGG